MTKQEIRDLWVERLESGTIKQSKGKLGLETGERCCLGVLCDIAVENGIIPPPSVCSARELSYAGTTLVLADKIRDWVGLSSNNGLFNFSEAFMLEKRHEEHEELTAMNDRGVSFSTIAALIKSKPRDLFND